MNFAIATFDELLKQGKIEDFAEEFEKQHEEEMKRATVDFEFQQYLLNMFIELKKENEELRKTLENDYYTIKEDWKGITYRDKQIAELEKELKCEKTENKDLVERVNELEKAIIKLENFLGIGQ